MTFFITHGKDHRRVLLAHFLTQRLPGGIAVIASRLVDLRLFFLALRLAGFVSFTQVIGKHRAEWRIGGGIKIIAQEGLAGQAERGGLNVHPGLLYREEGRFLLQRRFADLPQGGVIIQHVESPPEGAQHQVVLPGLDGDIAHCDGGQPALELHPLLPVVDAEEHPEFSAGKEQPRLSMVLGDGISRAALRQVGADRLPATPAIAALEAVRPEIAFLMIVEGGVDRIHIMLRGQQAVHVAHLRHPGNTLDLAPGATAVLADLYQAVVSTHVKQPLLQRRLAEGDDIAVKGSGLVLGHRLDRPHFIHHRQFVAVELAGEVRADRPPGIAAIVAAEEDVGTIVEPGMQMRADDQRGVPVPAQGRLPLARLGPDVDQFPAAFVVAVQSAVLILRIKDVRIFRIDLSLKPVAAQGKEPFAVGDPIVGVGAGRPTERIIILGAAINIVERRVIVDADLIELGYRQIGFEGPGSAAVEALVDPAVAAGQEIVGVVRIDPQGVVVDVLVALTHLAKVLTPILGHHHPGIHRINPFRIPGVAEQFLVVLRAAADVTAALFPALSAIGRAEETPELFLSFDDGVYNVGIGRRDRHPDAPHLAGGQAGLQLAPGGAGVARFVDCRARAAVDQGPDMTAALVGRGIKHVGIAGIEMHLTDAGVLVDVENALPAFSSIGAFVKPPFPAIRPQRPLRGHVDHRRIARVDPDHADVFGGLQAHVLPGLAAVERAVDAVAVAHAALAVILPGADPHHLGIGGIKRNAANRIGALTVEDRFPGGAGIDGFPYPAGSDGGVIAVRLLRIYCKITDPPGGDCRADPAERQPAKGSVGHLTVFRNLFLALRGHRPKRRPED